MINISRRSIIKTGIKTGMKAGFAAAGMASLVETTTGVALDANAQTVSNTAAFALQPLGKLAPRPARAIKASRLSLGFETLDRRMFEPEKTYAHVAELGVKWARCQTGWARTETKKGEFDFSWLDGVADSLAKVGVQPWFSLSYGNKLYTPGAPNEYAIGWIPLNNAEAKQAWVNYAGRIAQHFRTRVRHWEIWNEPNIPQFWQGSQPNAAQYVELVKLAAPAIRKYIPDAVIVGGGLAGMPKVADYLEQCLELGLAEQVDRISYHPYRQVPEANYEAEVRAFRSLLKRYKPGLELWQGENGAPSRSDGGYALSEYEWTEARQAKWLLRRLLTDLKLNIELTSYLHITDMHNYVGQGGMMAKVNYKGILHGKTYQPKPSYSAFQNLCALFDDETKPADFIIRSLGRDADDVYTASFIRAGAPVLVRWLPVATQRDTAAQTSSVELWSGKAAKLSEPVVIDLLSGQISKPTKTSFSGGWWKIEDVPLTDYPVVITDRAIIQSL